MIIAAFLNIQNTAYHTLSDSVEYQSAFPSNLFHSWVRKRWRSILFSVNFSESDSCSDHVWCESCSCSSGLSDKNGVGMFSSSSVWRMFRFLFCCSSWSHSCLSCLVSWFQTLFMLLASFLIALSRSTVVTWDWFGWEISSGGFMMSDAQKIDRKKIREVE